MGIAVDKTGKDLYITPNLSIYNSFGELISDQGYKFAYGLNDKHAFKFSDFYAGNNFFVLGEPGVGKSTLLGHLKDEASKNYFFSYLFYLPQIKYTELATKITEAYNSATKENYEFSPKNYMFCLDSLDEVNSEEFSDMLRTIIEISKKYSFKLIVSCRTHYLSKNISTIKGLQNFKFIKIQSFTNGQITNYVKEFAGEQAATIINKQLNSSHGKDWNSILRVPRYLDIQIKLAQESNSVEDFGKLKKADFFEKFIYKKLDEDKGDYNKNILTKRVLEKLALIMEIYQVNTITMDELVTFLDETDSNINLIFLNSENIEDFIQRVLKHSDFDKIEFDNTEFQEYLAAKELLRLGEKSLDLILEPNFKQIYPNWFDVLKYVVEIDPKQLVTIIDFLKKTTDKLISEDFFTLLDSVDVLALNKPQKAKIFDAVFEYFQSNGIYISRNADILSQFYTDDNEAFFNNILLSPSVSVSNQLYLLNYIVKQKVYKKKDDLILKIKTEITALTDISLINLCIHILAVAGDINNLIEVESIKNKSKEVFVNFCRACVDIDPNHDYCLKLIFEAVAKEAEEAITFLNKITDPVKIKQLFSKFNTDNELLAKFIELKGYFYSSDYFPVFKIISEHWDAEFNSMLLGINASVMNNNNQYDLDRNVFFKALINCLANNDDRFIENFISIKDPFFYNEFMTFLSKHVKQSNIEQLRNWLTSNDGKILLFHFYINIKFSLREKYNELMPFLEREDPEVFKRVNEYEPNSANNNDKIILARFSQELEPSPGKYSTNVFSTFLSNQKLILENAPVEEVEKLKSIIRNIFTHLNVDTFQLEITKYNKDSRGFSINNRYAYELPTYLKAAIGLGIEREFNNKRDVFIKLLPIMVNEDERKLMLDFIGEITADDIALLSGFCLNRTDDFLKYSSNNFIDLVSEYRIVALLPVVKGLLVDPMLREDERITAIKCIATIEDTKTSLSHFFTNYISATDTLTMAETANEYLISKYSDMDAIKWRMEELKKRKFAYKRSYANGVNPYTAEERELDHSTFANCLIGLRDIELMSAFNDLLQFSFTIRISEDYYEYSSYLQRIVFYYYKELKIHNSITPLKKLTLFFNNNDSIYKQSFKGFIKDLEIEYSQSVLKPNNIIDCVKKYNAIKEKRYLPITNDFELMSLLREIIDDELYNFVNNEGFYKTIIKGRLTEDTMQKILKIQFENSLHRRGFRDHDIYREPQSYNDKRPDLVVSYGFIGPVVIELKFISNPDITVKKKRTEYKDKLEKNYRKGFKAKYGIYLILEKDKTKNNSSIKNKLKTEYAELKEWSISFFKCYED